ncbi:MAG: SRPBCC domain-containing protein, partial [Bryobacteraceae bacterium]
VEVEASPQTVFKALTDPEQLTAWWGEDSVLRTFNWKVDPRVGGAWSCDAKGADGNLGSVEGRFLEVDSPRELVYTWNPSWDEASGETTVRYTLTPTDSGTLVTISHDGFPWKLDSLTGHLEGWSRVLNWLKSYIKTK